MPVPQLKTIATVVTIICTVTGGFITGKNYIDGKEAENVKQAVQHERHDEEIDRRLDRLELAIRVGVSNDSQKQRDLVEQVLAVKVQLKQVAQTQDQYVIPKLERKQDKHFDDNQYPADAPSVEKPQ